MNGNCTATSVQLICFCLPISVLLLETKERIQLKKESIGHNNVSPPHEWFHMALDLCRAPYNYVELHVEEMNHFRTNINHHAFNLLLVVHPYIANIRMNLFLQVCNILKPPFLSSWYWFWIQALISKESERKEEREGILTAIMAIYQVLAHQSLLKFYDL